MPVRDGMLEKVWDSADGKKIEAQTFLAAS
jgi:hypothetical protein